ncbi:CbiX/SirB N-terminal domain-containing protein [Candidatus Sumerlaeota bacterium]|nr:CbiX/SirB N-terminal domain-containing protein [Candidatus Sumerlaeota bacterium]
MNDGHPTPPAVLVVVHGSRNKAWVAQQRQWFAAVKEKLRSRFNDLVVELGFLEITDPLFESCLREMSLRHRHVLIFPFFLVRGGHVMKDIPAIASRVVLPGHEWELLAPACFAEVLGGNAEHRLRVAGAESCSDVIACGYGSASSDAHWLQLVADVRANAGTFHDKPWHWAATGHYLADNSVPLRAKIESLRSEGKTRLAILPLYLGISSYQTDLIPRVMKDFPEIQFSFAPTAILPDSRIEDWAVDAIVSALPQRSAAT